MEEEKETRDPPISDVRLSLPRERETEVHHKLVS